LEELKKTTAEEQAKANKRRMKFQAQVPILWFSIWAEKFSEKNFKLH
jgi:hypothetical protein